MRLGANERFAPQVGHFGPHQKTLEPDVAEMAQFCSVIGHWDDQPQMCQVMRLRCAHQ